MIQTEDRDRRSRAAASNFYAPAHEWFVDNGIRWHARCNTSRNPSKIMKTVLNYFSFVIAAGYISAEVAETAGVHLPAVVTAENAVIAFTSGLVLRMLVADYARKARVLPVREPTAAVAHPAAGASGGRRQAYTIRRGAEAARLAPPPPAGAFRKAPRVRYERAA